MKVTESIPMPDGADHHSIEFGISTWTEDAPEEEQTESVRRRYNGKTGRFSPRGSSEIPIEDMGLLMRECLKRDKISVVEMAFVFNEILASLKRQSPK